MEHEVRNGGGNTSYYQFKGGSIVRFLGSEKPHDFNTTSHIEHIAGSNSATPGKLTYFKKVEISGILTAIATRLNTKLSQKELVLEITSEQGRSVLTLDYYGAPLSATYDLLSRLMNVKDFNAKLHFAGYMVECIDKGGNKLKKENGEVIYRNMIVVYNGGKSKENIIKSVPNDTLPPYTIVQVKGKDTKDYTDTINFMFTAIDKKVNNTKAITPQVVKLPAEMAAIVDMPSVDDDDLPF